MIEITKNNKIDCCGCNACNQICPSQCISMVIDEEGFKYPKINNEKCIECNKCEEVCPIIQHKNNEVNGNEKPKAVGGWHKNSEVRYNSSSGGAFTLLAEFALKKNGIVFGAGFDKSLDVKHMGIANIENLDVLRRSKYVQSDIGNIYIEVKENLEKGRTVLFVGTPCQVAGLDSFLNKKYENLIKCDFICHGVPSPVVFNKYIDYLEEKYKKKIVEFKFRNKEKGWRQTGQQMGTAIKFEDGSKKNFMPAYKDYFMNGFLSDVYLRPSCHACTFKSLPKKYVDFTIADFWGIDSVSEKLNDKRGTSLILLNSEKAETIFENIKENFYYEECEFEKAIQRNLVIKKSVSPSFNREKFFRDFENMNFNVIALKYLTGFSWAFEKAIKIIRKK